MVVVLVVKNLPANAGDIKDASFDPWVRKIPLETEMATYSIFFRGRFRGQRSLVGYSPRGSKESYTTECAHTHTHSIVVKKDT